MSRLFFIRTHLPEPFSCNLGHSFSSCQNRRSTLKRENQPTPRRTDPQNVQKPSSHVSCTRGCSRPRPLFQGCGFQEGEVQTKCALFRKTAMATPDSPSSSPVPSPSALSKMDTELDDRILSALNELNLPANKSRTLKFPNGPSASKTEALSSRAQEAESGSGSRSEESDSDDEGDCPDTMGYMPLPQDPDMDGTCDDVSLSSRDVGECAQPHQTQREGKCKTAHSVISKGAGISTASRLEEGISVLLHRLLILSTFYFSR